MKINNTMSSVTPCYLFVIKSNLFNFITISVFSVLKPFYGLIRTVLSMLLKGMGRSSKGQLEVLTP